MSRLLVSLIVILFSTITLSDLTLWELLAHGSDRAEYNCKRCSEWNVTTDMDFRLITWAVPYGLGATLPGGIAQRTSDGHIHIQLLGTVKNNLGPEWPGGGSTKGYGPPFIWEIDPSNGKTVGLYNLSDYGTTFYSIVRYLPNDEPIFAICNGTDNGYEFDIKLYQLNNKGEVVWEKKPSLEPMLLQTTNTNPQEVLYAGMNSDGFVTYNEKTGMPNDMETTNGYMSTIIFGTDGQTLYNNGFSNEATGVYRMKIPFDSNTRQTMVYKNCETYPWVMASDTKGNLYLSCYGVPYSTVAIDSTGNVLWGNHHYPNWLILSDDESTVIVGSTTYWMGYNSMNGDMIFNTTIGQITQRTDGNSLKCYESGQPWASRFPITVPNVGLVLLCSNSKGYDIRILSIEDGSMIGQPLMFNIPEVNMLIADQNSVYGFGYNDGKISAERINLPTKRETKY